MFMRQKRNETARLIWIAPRGSLIRADKRSLWRDSNESRRFVPLFFFLKLTRADAFTRGWDGHASTKQRCEIQYEALAFMI